MLGGGLSKSRALLSLVEEAERCSNNVLSYEQVVNIWKSCGPVAAKFYSWIKKLNHITHNEGPTETCCTKYREHIFHLPGCDKELEINTGHGLEGNFKGRTVFKVTCGNLKIENNVFFNIPEDYNSWDEEEIKSVVDPMQPVINLLQKELGETVPLITDKFFVWMCFLFPLLKDKDKLYFKDEAKNAKPILDSLPLVLDRYKQNRPAKFEKDLEVWMEDKDRNHCAQVIAHLLSTLVQKSHTQILRQFGDDVSRLFFSIPFDCFFVEDYPVDYHRKMLLDLVNRTTLFPNNYSAEIVPVAKFVTNKAHFRMLGQRLMTMDASMYGSTDEDDNFTWYQLSLNFYLPEGNKVQIQTGDIQLENTTHEDRQALIDQFSPITAILQECIDECLKNVQDIPKIDNAFTINYWMDLMDFTTQTEIFFDA